MANKTNFGTEATNITASTIQQATASTVNLNDGERTSTPNIERQTLPPSVVAAVRFHGERLSEILFRFSATDYLSQLQAMDFEYKELLHAIDAGGHLERNPQENPAEVLAELRNNYTPTPRQVAERANLLRCIGDILREVEGLTRALEIEEKRANITICK